MFNISHKPLATLSCSSQHPYTDPPQIPESLVMISVCLTCIHALRHGTGLWHARLRWRLLERSISVVYLHSMLSIHVSCLCSRSAMSWNTALWAMDLTSSTLTFPWGLDFPITCISPMLKHKSPGRCVNDIIAPLRTSEGPLYTFHSRRSARSMIQEERCKRFAGHKLKETIHVLLAEPLPYISSCGCVFRKRCCSFVPGFLSPLTPQC